MGSIWVIAGFYWVIAGFAGIKVLNAEFWFITNPNPYENVAVSQRFFFVKKLNLSYFNPVIELVKNVYLSYPNRKYVGICYYIMDPKINYKFLHRGFSKIVLQMENIHWVTDL